MYACLVKDNCYLLGFFCAIVSMVLYIYVFVVDIEPLMEANSVII